MVNRHKTIVLYRLLKIWIRIGLQFYCKELRFSVQAHQGPTILACNHPNSFLDALIIGSQYKYPIHFLARGDVFAKPLVNHLLRRMSLIPIHRLSEGKEGLKANEQSFRECIAVLAAGGTLLIFSEGLCKNQWQLLPLKKGTARLAYRAWRQQALPELVVKPVSLSYSGFAGLPLLVEVKEGPGISPTDVTTNDPASFYNNFNAVLQKRLVSNLRSPNKLVPERKFAARWLRWLLTLPAGIGWLTHRGLYKVVRNIAIRKTAGTVFYHSVLFGLLLLIYPLFLIVLTSSVVLLTQQLLFWWLLVLLPITAWCYKELKGLE